MSTASTAAQAVANAFKNIVAALPAGVPELVEGLLIGEILSKGGETKLDTFLGTLPTDAKAAIGRWADSQRAAGKF